MSKRGLLACRRSAKHGKVSHNQCGCATLFLIERVMMKKQQLFETFGVYLWDCLTPVNLWCAVRRRGQGAVH